MTGGVCGGLWTLLSPVRLTAKTFLFELHFKINPLCLAVPKLWWELVRREFISWRAWECGGHLVSSSVSVLLLLCIN